MKRRREFKPYCSILRAALLSGRIRMERERDMPNGLDFKSLKDKQQKLRDGFPDNVSLRIHRSLSWIERAGTCAGDDSRTTQTGNGKISSIVVRALQDAQLRF